ncbi:MAG: RNA degradosome polyphosphate kinase [Sphingopyxis sp.]
MTTAALHAKAASEPARHRYFNRELSWLAFNHRVMEEARNPAHPLLERLRFLSISGNNLDEFFMVRVAGLKAHQLQGIEHRSQDGLSVAQQLASIDEASRALVSEQQEQFARLSAELAGKGITIVERIEDAQELRTRLELIFEEQILPLLTPQALDPSHPFPFIPNRGLAVLFDLVRNDNGQSIRELVMVPPKLPRFVRLEGELCTYIALDTVIALFSNRIFPDFTVVATGRFRVIRDSDIELEEEAEDLVQYFRSAIRARRRGRIVMAEFSRETPDRLVEELLEETEDSAPVILRSAGLIGFGDLLQIVSENRPDLKFLPYVARFPERIRDHGGDCFAAIRSKDILVHHPYESFDVVLAFLRQAAADPDVLAIKQTLYRAGDQSPVIRALIEAAEAGKAVTAVIELKARFDEERNLHWAEQLEQAGVQVVYGFIDWKTHAKLSMVVRREGDNYRSYCHFGTGNYHPITARIYTDFSFFTADDRAGRDCAQIFNFITGYIEPNDFEMVTIAPLGLRERILTLIDAEIDNANNGRASGIWAKMNSLVDARVIDKLYEASAAGVPIDLIVRGICCLRPNVQGLSENIRVKSVVGRFLEHSRVFAFANGAALPSRTAKLFISSADWMNRNFDRRVEYMIPIENQTVHDQLLDQVLLANLLDNEQSWELQSDGSYQRTKSTDKPFNLHTYFMNNPSLSGRGETFHHRHDVPRLTPLGRHA